MDEPNEKFAADSAVLQALAEGSEALHQASRAVREKPCVASVSLSFDLRNIRSGSSFDVFLEVGLQNKADMTWFIAITWTPDWTIESGIRLNRYSEQEWVTDFGEWTMPSSAEFIAQLHEVVHTVVASLHVFDFCSVGA